MSYISNLAVVSVQEARHVNLDEIATARLRYIPQNSEDIV